MEDGYLVAGAADAVMRIRRGRFSRFGVWMEGGRNWVSQGVHNGRWVDKRMGRKAAERCGMVEGMVR
jgi:hypothetical protein